MKQPKWTCLLLAVLLSIMSSPASAHRGGHFRGYGGHYRGYGGYGFGYYPRFPWPFYWSFYAPYYAYPPSVVTIPASPPIYIERDPVQTRPRLPANYWYYCRNPDGYYPYVRECPGGWHQVSPHPPYVKDPSHE